MEEIFQPVAALVVAYLLGSVDFGVLVSRRMGVDIYEHGSGNPGTSNVLRTLGKKAAGLVLLGDALKGLVAVGIASWLGGETVGFAAAFLATAGHSFPIWHRFRGGRGVATAIGGAIWLEPLLGLALAIGWLAIVLATKTASIASLGAMALYVPLFLIAGHRGWAILWAALTAALVIWRHSDNIRRILTRAENRVPT
ncbi:MAG: glycerol-3-phosphate 1-O-acyltransferase PlsY [Acidimicrobiia bacterium]|nr:glycerol-3-phosphate 1-O-acyltransferase PlsY [Acidimicrobiia bacterium]